MINPQPATPPTGLHGRTASLPFHPERERLFNELHNRPFPVLGNGSRVSQWAILHDTESAQAELAHLQALCERYSLPPPAASSSCYYQHFEGFEFRWERHNEFSTHTFIATDNQSLPFQHNALARLPDGWLQRLPGQMISAQHIEIIDCPDPEPSADTLRPCFEGQRLISSWIGEQQARLWTAYRIHADGFGRILILNRQLNSCQSGRLVRALLEIETYRMMMLTSIPLAQRIAPQVSEMAHQLADVNQQITEIRGFEDERRLLGQLSALAARTEHMISESRYRFSASRAYYDLVISRLKDLREQEVSGLQTVGEFLRRRLTPAHRTCQSVSTQLTELAERIDRTSELLRTRVNLALEAQNQQLLHSMNERGQLQLKLQQAVEGLSVAAISYYLVGLTGYIMKALHDIQWIKHPQVYTAAAVPLSVGVVAWGIRRLRRSLH